MLSLLLFAMLFPIEPHQGNPDPPRPILIRHATVIDVRDGSSMAGRTVRISGGKIAQIVPDDAYSPVEPDPIFFDATGKFLIPGLWDMHVHLVRPDNFNLYLANGVTGVRVMWGNPAMIGIPIPHAMWKAEIEAGKRAGPRMVVASNILDGPKPIWPGSVAIRNEEEARAVVKKAKASGAEFIKVYSLLAPEAFRAIAAASKAEGLPFVGHVPWLVSAAEASDLGMKSMEHLYGIVSACSPSEDEFLKARKAILDETQGDWQTARAKLRPIEAKILASYSDERAAQLFARLKGNGTWQCPTLTVLRGIANMDDPAFTDDPRMKYIDLFTKLYWNPKNDFRFKSMKPEDFAAQRELFARTLEFVAKMHKAGVPFLAGTDEGNPYIFPGFSLHDELGLLVKAGFSPIEAIQAATLNPARYLGQENRLGTVEPGKEADLLLLDADPRLDIANTKKIAAVVARGRIYDRAALDAMLKAAEIKKPQEAKPAGGALPVGGFCTDH
jgi:imidazolonepropionase-like amidohydrolase